MTTPLYPDKHNSRMHFIEIVIILVFHKVVSEVFKHFKQDGDYFGIVIFVSDSFTAFRKGES